MLEALVLAGGASTRMGSVKALLPSPDGRLFVIRIVETLREAGIATVTIVTGQHHGVIVDACAPLIEAGIASCVRNPDPARGQLSSLITGMDAAVGPRTEGLLVTLVDVPMVTTATVRQIIASWERTHAPIVRPVVGDAHGHPVIFSREVFDALRSAPVHLGAKSVVRSYEAQIEHVAVSDAGCLKDVDTPEDYARLNELS